MRVRVCINHPEKPVSKQCKICKQGYCKYCKTRETTNYNGDWDGLICEKCDGIEAKRGVIHFTP